MKRALLLVLALTAACASVPHGGTVGQSIGDLLQPISGGPEQAQRSAGRVVLLEIWASWCQPCSQDLALDEALLEELGPKGLTIITINVDADRRAADAFLRDLDLTSKLPVLFDPEAREVERHLDIRQLPTSYFIDRRGHVRQVERGFTRTSSDRARSILRDLLKEPRP
jgi:thiol-disulfide isomerase/thioredoxin